MATIRLGRYEAREGLLPPVCMRCGTVAGDYRRRFFACWPWWIYLGIPLPFFILASRRRHRERVLAPLCETHKNQWRWQHLLALCAGLAVMIGLGVGPLIVLEQTQPLPAAGETARRDKLVFLAWSATAAGPFLYLALTFLLRRLEIHAVDMTPTSITLAGVAPEFVEAVQVNRRAQSSGGLMPATGSNER